MSDKTVNGPAKRLNGKLVFKAQDQDFQQHALCFCTTKPHACDEEPPNALKPRAGKE